MLQYMDKNVKIYHISGNIMLLQSGLVNQSTYIILRNRLTKSLKSSFQSVYRCLQLVQRQL